MQAVYSSAYQQDVEELLALLRAEGLNPMMISHGVSRGRTESVYEVRLPPGEVAIARPLIQFFQVKSAKTPS